MAKKKQASKRPPAKQLAAALEPPEADATAEKLAHYQQVCALNTLLLEKRVEFYQAKSEAKERRKELNQLSEDLVLLIKRGPDPQKSLDFPDSDDPAKPTHAPSWRGWTVDLLDLPPGVIKLLENNHLMTLGTLRDFWREGRVLHEAIKGMGEEKAAQAADAWAELSKEHPEINE